jgi:predicted nucleotidyltransferase
MKKIRGNLNDINNRWCWFYKNSYSNRVIKGVVMLNIEEIKSEIVDRLKPLSPNKIILFGSYAYGTPNEDSDIDLYVVTNDDFMPQNWREKMQIKLKFSKALRDIREHYDIDLITHTKKMYEKFLELDSMFSREILAKGKVIYG